MFLALDIFSRVAAALSTCVLLGGLSLSGAAFGYCDPNYSGCHGAALPPLCNAGTCPESESTCVCDTGEPPNQNVCQCQQP